MLEWYSIWRLLLGVPLEYHSGKFASCSLSGTRHFEYHSMTQKSTIRPFRVPLDDTEQYRSRSLTVFGRAVLLDVIQWYSPYRVPCRIALRIRPGGTLRNDSPILKIRGNFQHSVEEIIVAKVSCAKGLRRVCQEVIRNVARPPEDDPLQSSWI